MEISKLTDFFGLPAQHDDLDQYLLANGFTERPIFIESPIESIDWEAGGLSLIFKKESIYNRWHGEPRAPGDMIFTSVQAYGPDNDSGFSAFRGRLPFELNLDMTLQQARSILGESSLDQKTGATWVYVWKGLDGFDISLSFLQHDKGVSFFDISKEKIKRPAQEISSTPSPIDAKPDHHPAAMPIQPKTDTHMTTSKPAPDASILLEHLGQAIESLDPSILAQADDPNYTLPDHSPIGGVFFTRYGISLTICPPDFYHVNDRLTGMPPILTNVQLYAGDQEYSHDRYTGPLPFGLAFEDDHAAVVAKLGEPSWRFPLVSPVRLARFDLIDRWLLVVYGTGPTPISMFQIGLKPKRGPATVLPKILQPDIRALESMLTQPWRTVAAHPDFAGTELTEFLDTPGNEDCPHEVDALPTHGLELYFRPSRTLPDAAPVLSGARYIRKGVHQSVGFDGELPCGLRFSDTLETAFARIGSWPVTGRADALSGYYIWRLPDYLLQVGFSVMEQRINRIYLSAHGYYSQSLLDSPLLEQPAQPAPAAGS